MSIVLWAGFAATVLSACWYWLGRSLGWTLYSPMLQVGCIVLRQVRGAISETVGTVLFLLLGSTLVAGLYAALLFRMGEVSWVSGAVLGMIHGALFTAALPAVGTIDACVRDGLLPPPQRWGLGWGWPTPMVVVVGHALYGAVLGAVLAAF
ncbi:MAG: hypothetical protein M3434_09310 [Gemmatimonadota bacterium]|nr:hypothetical protein [Gemmatimonadota bacterium]